MNVETVPYTVVEMLDYQGEAVPFYWDPFALRYKPILINKRSWPVFTEDGSLITVADSWQEGSCTRWGSQKLTMADFRGGVWTLDVDTGAWYPPGF